jgi:para-nitrobenzyl esterase
MDTIARTGQGRVKGREKEGILLFAGIPYTSPPTGEARFRPPRPHPGWPGVRSAERFGKVAPQLPSPLGGFLDPLNLDWSEDCLTLNVATPALDDAARPVMVWIHGGGFLTGTSATPWYNGASFVRRGGVVVVSINYRLGALGFLHLGALSKEHASSGNNGILDQIAALEWVRDNIRAFGGDPENVTIFGESAGGMSVGTLLGTPAAQGLYRRAIAQSGACHTSLSPATAARVSELFCERAGGADLEALLRLPVEKILEAQTATLAHLMRHPSELDDGRGLPLGLAFQPVVDGVLLPKAPIQAVREGNAAGIPVLTGTNLDEQQLFLIANPPKLDRAQLLERLARLFGDGERAHGVYASDRPGASEDDLYSAVLSDRIFRIPAIRLAEAQSGHEAKTYLYLFTWRSRAFGGRLGACHALEIPFVFNNLTRGGVEAFIGQGDLPSQLAEAMHDAWIAFAHGGDPNQGGTPPWPTFETSRRATMEFGDRIGVLHDPHGAERQLWEDRL